MNTAAQILRRDVPRLVQALALDESTARLEVRILLGHALGASRAWLIAHEYDPLPPQALPRYEAMMRRRLVGEPVAYILGEKEFYGRIFKVTPDVLIPRPETELLVEVAIAQCGKKNQLNILDLGTGSGCIAITLALECPAAQVSAIEVSKAALEKARENAEFHRATVEFIQSHWFEALGERQFDIIVANPPYIAPGDPHLQLGDVRHEPISALVAQDNGLGDIQLILKQANIHLRKDGMILLEHGYNQGSHVKSLFHEAGFAKAETWRDLARIERVTVGKVSE